MVQVGVNSLGAHVGYRSDGGIAGVDGLREDSTDSEIGYFDVFLRVDKEVRGFDVSVDDFASVKIGDATENLAGDVR